MDSLSWGRYLGGATLLRRRGFVVQTGGAVGQLCLVCPPVGGHLPGISCFDPAAPSAYNVSSIST
jgi:hypothetical protein